MLEQVIIIYIPNIRSESYKSASFRHKTLSEYFKVHKNTFRKSGILISGVNKKEYEIYEKVSSAGIFLKDVTETCRGLPWQKYRVDAEGEEILKGDNIGRYELVGSPDKVRVLDTTENLKKISKLKQEKIISQNIVAHVMNPSPHIIITATIDYDKSLTLDTINNTITLNRLYSLEFLLGILNSRLISWYTYHFIYNQAIRTMHFDEHYVGRIPLPVIKQDSNLEYPDKSLDKLINNYQNEISIK